MPSCLTFKIDEKILISLAGDSVFIDNSVMAYFLLPPCIGPDIRQSKQTADSASPI